MMATAGPPSNSSFLPLLESLEDGAAGPSEQTDAYLTIAKYVTRVRLSRKSAKPRTEALNEYCII